MTAGAKPSDSSRASALRCESFSALRLLQANARPSRKAIRLTARGVGGTERAAAVKRPGERLDPLGRRIERSRDRVLGHLDAISRDHAGVLQRRELVLDAAQLRSALAQFVGDGQRRHHGEPHVANLAEVAAQLRDALVEIAGEAGEVLLLPVVAGHAVVPAVDADRDRRHRDQTLGSDGVMMARMVAIASSSRCATSRLVTSSARARAVATSSSAASRARSLSKACTCEASAAWPWSRSSRRPTAPSSASSADCRRRVALSIVLASLTRHLAWQPEGPAPAFKMTCAAMRYKQN